MNKHADNPAFKAGSAAHELVAPVFLLLCLILGGSAQGFYFNLLLQLVGLAIILWAAIAPAEQPLVGAAGQLFLLVILALALVALQLIPLPASIWPALGGREAIADGYRTLAVPIAALPVSLAPYASFAAVVTIIPALAMLCAVVRLKAYRPGWLALALLAGTFAGILLGALQVGSGDPHTSPWYLYGYSSFGFAVGFFANANHMAALLVIALPFLAALLQSADRGNVQRYSAALALSAGATLVIIVGIALNRSLAAYGLAIPVFVGSLLLIVPGRSRARPWIAAASVVLLIGAGAALAIAPVGERRLGTSASLQSRAAINSTTSRAIIAFLPFGSGLGTFKPVYKIYEDHERIEPTIINHAHNDYAELALETGLPGLVLMLLFLAWWVKAALRAWRSPGADPYARAASIASATLLVHSLVDFPLRTVALSTCFAMCLGLLVDRRTARAGRSSELWPTRHLVVG